jgi:hypothetical protein
VQRIDGNPPSRCSVAERDSSRESQDT